MNNISMRRFFIILFILALASGSCNMRIFHKAKEPRVVLKAKKKQETKERKLKKNYAHFFLFVMY